VLSLHALFELITETDVLAARDVPRIVLQRATTNTWFASHCGGRHTPRKRRRRIGQFRSGAAARWRRDLRVRGAAQLLLDRNIGTDFRGRMAAHRQGVKMAPIARKDGAERAYRPVVARHDCMSVRISDPTRESSGVVRTRSRARNAGMLLALMPRVTRTRRRSADGERAATVDAQAATRRAVGSTR
jgi:hypothetical protein